MGYQLIYNKLNGDIIEMISEGIDIFIYYTHYDESFKSSISSIIVDKYLTNLDYYKIINNGLVKKDDGEIEEIKIYGRILTEEERLNILIMPSHQEIQKAETTIETMSLLQEVGLI